MGHVPSADRKVEIHSMSAQRIARGRSKKVLVLGGETSIILPIIRSLGRQGIAVHLGWCPSGEPALRSRYLAKVHALSAYRLGDRRWQNDLRSVCAAEDFDLVIPASEPAVFPLLLHRQEISGIGPMHLMSEEAFTIAFDKAKTWDISKRLGIRVPQGVVVSADCPALRELRYPVVVKPLCSVDPAALLHKNFVCRAAAYDELSGRLEQMLSTHPSVLVQEVFPGTGAGVETLCHKGEILCAFQHVRLHETSGYGSTYRMSVPVDPELLAASANLLGALNYTGVAMVEFRLDRRSRDWVLIELNARFWGSLPLSVAAGADFPYYLYQLLVEGQPAPRCRYRSGVRCRNLLGDVRWMWRSLNRSRYGPDSAHGFSQGWHINAISRRQLLKDAIRAAVWVDHVDTLTWDDPRPCLAELGRLAGLVAARAF
jgi:predicted ATP-grasp superfamily ATP-dependent carboligase